MNPHLRPYIDFETTWRCWGLGVTAFFRRWKQFPCEVFINMGPWTLSFGWRLRHVDVVLRADARDFNRAVDDVRRGMAELYRATKGGK